MLRVPLKTLRRKRQTAPLAETVAGRDRWRCIEYAFIRSLENQLPLENSESVTKDPRNRIERVGTWDSQHQIIIEIALKHLAGS